MKLLIDIKGDKPLSAYGDNHIIAYDPNSKNYYVTTADSFFAGQNAKIREIRQQIDETKGRIVSLQQELTSFENVIQGKVDNFTANIDAKFENFLRTYQETNAKLIAMVKELIEAKEE